MATPDAGPLADAQHAGPRASAGAPAVSVAAVARIVWLSGVLIIRYAYELEPYQSIDGGAGLLDARFEIEALIPELPPTTDPSREMLQTLLADRFKLSVEWTTRSGMVYALVPTRRDGQLGPAIRPSATDCAGERTKPDGIGDRAMTAEEFSRFMRPAYDMTYHPFRASIHGGARGMADLTAFLSCLPEPGGLVVDRTGLAGAYDFQLEFARSGTTAAQDVSRRLPTTGTHLSCWRSRSNWVCGWSGPVGLWWFSW